MHIKAFVQLIFVVCALVGSILRGLHLWKLAHSHDSHSHPNNIPVDDNRLSIAPHLAHEPTTYTHSTTGNNATLASIPAFHFVQISDLHISRYNTHGGHLFFLDFLRSVLPVVNPSMVFVTGDLTDAKSETKLTSQQFPDEWSAYASALSAAHVDPVSRPNYWFDLRGNHDCFDVHGWTASSNLFQSHSSTRAAGFSHLAQFPFGSYLFVGIDACPRRGIRRPFNFFGRIDRDDLDHIEHAYARHPKTNHTFWFAHYPMGTVHAGSETLSSRGSSLASLARRASVTMCGHLHRFKAGLGDQMYTQWSPAAAAGTTPGGANSGLLELELADIKHHAAYRVVVVDQDRVAFVDTEVRVKDETGKSEHASAAKLVQYPGQVMATLDKQEQVAQPPVVVVTYPKDGRFAIPHRESLASRMVPVTDPEQLRQRPMRLFIWTRGQPDQVHVSVDINGQRVQSPAMFHTSSAASTDTMPLWTVPWDPNVDLGNPTAPLVHTLRVTVHDTSTNLTSSTTTHFRLDGRRISTAGTHSTGEWIVSTNFDALIRRVLFAGYIPLLLVLALSKTFVILQGPAAYAAWFHSTSHALVTTDQHHVQLTAPLRSITWGLRAQALRLCELARRNSVWYPLMLATCWLAVGPMLLGRFLTDAPSVWDQRLYWFGFHLDNVYVPVADAWLFATFKVWQVYWPFTMYVSFNAVPPEFLYAVGNVRRSRPVHAWWTIRATVAAVVVYHVWNYLGLGIFYGWESVVLSPLGWIYVWMVAILVRSMVRPWKPAPVGVGVGGGMVVDLACKSGLARGISMPEVMRSGCICRPQQLQGNSSGKSEREMQ